MQFFLRFIGKISQKSHRIFRNILTKRTFSRIIYGMEKKGRKVYAICLCVLMTLLCAGLIGWIFSNSLKTAEASTEQSASAMGVIQKIFAAIAPNSIIATATGEDYDRVHTIVRMIAHFTEFAVLGALLIWCWRTYTGKRLFLFIPIALMVIVPILDETLQSFTAGRAMEFTDVLIDLAGGIFGGGFAVFTLWIGYLIIKKKKKKGKENGERELANRAD